MSNEVKMALLAAIAFITFIVVAFGFAFHATHENNIKTRQFNEACLSSGRTPVETMSGQVCVRA